MSVPRVSVVMPVLNRDKYLPTALDSVLWQTMDNWELAVSDAGSSDATRDILADYARRDSRIRWFDHPGLGIATARNALLPEIRGVYMAVLDSDDLALPGRLKRQADFLDSRPDIIATGSNLEFIDGRGSPTDSNRYPERLTDPTELRLRVLGGWGCFVHTSMMIRTDAMRAVGGYREIYRHAEDDDLFLRLLERGDLTNIPEILVQYRVSEHNAERSERPLYRAAALASAHLRRAGLNDPMQECCGPVSYMLLQDMLELLGTASLPVRLFWIGMLQYHRTCELGMLEEAWRAVLSLPLRNLGQMAETIRHWRNFVSWFPKMAEEMRRKFTCTSADMYPWHYIDEP